MVDYGSKKSKKTTEAGTKARQRDDKEDRTIAYRDWRRTLGKEKKTGRLRDTPYTSDVDQVEYIFHKNEPHPVALLELTRYDFDEYDGPSQRWAKYRSSILDRFFLRDAQGKFMKMMSARLGIPAFIVLFRNDLQSFWLFDMCHQDALWERKDPEEYAAWLTELKSKKLEELKAQDV